MKKFLFMTAFITFLALPACAELSVDDNINEVYLKNHGYSKALIENVKRQVANVNGEEYETPAEHELYRTPVAIYVRRFFTYIDPGLDAETFWNHKNINTTTKWSDL